MTVAPTIPHTTPRSLEVLLQHVRAEAACSHCGAEPGKSCVWLGRQDMHLGRFVRAYTQDLITADELAKLLVGVEHHNQAAYGRFGMALIIRDGAR